VPVVSGRKNGFGGEGSRGDLGGIANRIAGFDCARTCVGVGVWRLRTSMLSWVGRRMGDFCAQEVVACTPSSVSLVPVALTYLDGLTSGRLFAFFLPHVRGGKLISTTRSVHAMPNRTAPKMRTSRPYGKALDAGLDMLAWSCISYAARGTMACGYRNPGGEGRGYVERRDSAGVEVVGLRRREGERGEPGMTPCGTEDMCVIGKSSERESEDAVSSASVTVTVRVCVSVYRGFTVAGMCLMCVIVIAGAGVAEAMRVDNVKLALEVDIGTMRVVKGICLSVALRTMAKQEIK
jgi:hypothetical protein